MAQLVKRFKIYLMTWRNRYTGQSYTFHMGQCVGTQV